MFPRKKLVTVGFLLLCVLVSIGASLLFSRNFAEGLEPKTYIEDLTEHLNIIEDAIQNEKRTSNQSKYDEIYNLIQKIPDSTTYTYKTELLDIMKNKGKMEEEDAIYKKLMDQIKIDRKQQINDQVGDSKSKAGEKSKDPETQKLQNK